MKQEQNTMHRSNYTCQSSMPFIESGVK